MRYKEGDKVIIKSLEWYNKNKDESGIVTFSTDRGDYNVTKEDERFFGRVVTITYVEDGYYIIAEDDRGYVWIDEMIEGPSTSIYNEGDIVGVYGYETDVRIEEVRWDGASYSYKVYLAGEEEWLYGDDIAYDVETYNSSAAYNPRPSLTNSIENKKKEYPKTYEECCKILDFCGEYFFTTYEDGIHFPGEDNNIYQILKSTSILTKLLICRNAYWKIAGEEMGLGKPWEPDWKGGKLKYVILYDYGEIRVDTCSYIANRILTFPTEEIRDAFYDNFKKEIEICKELL